jgi:hypothetical protein
MSLLKSKIARRSAAGLSAVALIGAVALPSTVMGQSITLNRCPANGTGGPSPLCTSEIGVPIAAQQATQTSTVDPSVTNAQTSDATVSASNRNRAIALDVNAQAQKAVQVGGDQSNDQSNDQSVDASASNRTSGGDTLARSCSGH